MRSMIKSQSTPNENTMRFDTKNETEATTEPNYSLNAKIGNTQSNLPLVKSVQSDRKTQRFKLEKKKDSCITSLNPMNLRRISKFEMKSLNFNNDVSDLKVLSPMKTGSFFSREHKEKPGKRFSLVLDPRSNSSKYTELEKLDERVLNDHMLMRAYDSDAVWNSLENFAFRGQKNAIFNLNNFDSQFNRTNYAYKHSFNDFFQKYATHRELIRKNVIKKETPTFAFIREIKASKRVPYPHGLIKKTGDENEVNLDNCSVGDEYILILAKSIIHSEVNHVRKLDLELNRLSLSGVTSMFNILKYNRKTVTYLRKINLSNNNLGGGFGEVFHGYLSEGDCHLKEVILENTLISDEAAKLICYSISKYVENDLAVCNLGRNKLSETCASSISDMVNLCDSLKVLQLHENDFSNSSAALIVRAITKNKEMKFFDISWNKLGDDLNIEPIREEVYKENLNPLRVEFRNYDLKEFRQTMAMKFKDIELPANPNEKKPKVAKVGKVKSEDYLRALKFQKNIKLPATEPSEFAKALGDLFKSKTSTLMHLNISNNSLNLVDCSHIANTVKNNQTILGIHVDGNEMEIDQLGFIHPKSKHSRSNNYFANSQISYKTMYDKEKEILCGNSLLKTSVSAHKIIKHKNNCWICEEWRETAFSLEHHPNIVGSERASKRDAKIYLEIDKWNPYEMNFVQSDNKSVAYRMCPPGDIRFVFTLDNRLVDNIYPDIEILKDPLCIELEALESESDYEDNYFDTMMKSSNKNINSMRSSISNFNSTMNNTKLMKLAANFESRTANRNSSKKLFGSSNKLINVSPDGMKSGRDLLHSKREITQTTESKNVVHVSSVSKTYVFPNSKNVDALWVKHFLHCHPRPRKDEEFVERPRTPWSFPISIWARQYYYEFEGESEETFMRAFTYDFNRCNFIKDMKNEIEQYEVLRELLKIQYKKIVNAYKVISSQTNPIWQIGNSAIIDFLNKANGLLSTSYPQSFMNLKMQSVKSADNEETKKKNKNVPEGIVRHQLMNLLVKVGIDKYVNNLKQFKLPIDAVKYSFETHFNVALENYEDPQEWRKSRYYKEYTDNFVQSHLPLFHAIYRTWSTKKDSARRDKFMILDDFHSLCTALVDKECPVREIDLYFNQAIQLQENEIDFDRHYFLIFPEFIEAFCRVVDKASLGATEGQELNIKLDFVREKLQPLIASTQEMKPLKEKFVLPQKKELGLYEFDNNSQFYREILFPDLNSQNMAVNFTTVKRRSTKLGSKFLDSAHLEKARAAHLQIQEEAAEVMKTISENANTVEMDDN